MTQSRKIRLTIVAAAVGTLLPLGAAHALDILGNKFASPVSGQPGPEYDTSMFGHVYILGNSIPVAKMSSEGAQGPVRAETMNAPAEAAKTPENAKLYILGNTFWLPGKEGGQ